MPSLGRVECLMRISRWPQFQAEVAQFQAEVVAVAGSPEKESRLALYRNCTGSRLAETKQAVSFLLARHYNLIEKLIFQSCQEVSTVVDFHHLEVSKYLWSGPM